MFFLHQTKLSTIIEQLIELEKEEKKNNGYFNEALSKKIHYMYLDFLGEENERIANLLNLLEDIHLHSDRRNDEDILTSDEMVNGDISIFTSGNHDNGEHIWTVTYLDNAKDYILSVGGIFNMFRADIQVFVKGKRTPYSIFFCDDKGNRYVFEKSRTDEDVFSALTENNINV